MTPLPSNPLTETLADAARFVRSGCLVGARCFLAHELRQGFMTQYDDLRWLRMSRAHNWLANGQPGLALEVLTANDKWRFDV